MAENKRKPIWPGVHYDSKAKAITSSGKVHYVTVGVWKNGNVDPLCNHRSWAGDYWGKPWKTVDKDTPVTCKNCLAAAGETTHKVKVIFSSRWPQISAAYAPERTEEVIQKVREFKTKAEADAYIKGLGDGKGWLHIGANGKVL